MTNLGQKFVGFMFVLALVLSAAAYTAISYLESPISGSSESHEIMITIKRGASFKEIVRVLKSQKLLKKPAWFQGLAYLRGDISRIKAGEFIVDGSWTPGQMLDHLIAGRTRLYRITFPEGVRYKEAVQRLVEAGLGDLDRFMELFKDQDMLQLIGWPEAISLEGFLFPDTYFFSKHQTEEEMIRTMLNQFMKYLPLDYESRTLELGLTPYETLTLASIIEKETGKDSDRPLISAVFHDRLKKKMRIESDPTVIYDIEDFDGNLTRKHLKTNTPHNTYRIRGLPPGPIANPGKSSIHSALYPAKVNYLYFVATGDGSSYFSSDLRSHNRAVWRYQIHRNRQKKQAK